MMNYKFSIRKMQNNKLLKFQIKLNNTIIDCNTFNNNIFNFMFNKYY